MKEIIIKSYAKINLSLDVLGILPSGYHQVEMIMQQIELHDLVKVEWNEAKTATQKIILTTDNEKLPTNNHNIAYKAAELMMKYFDKGGEVKIHIEKRIPIAAGLAGGSGNAAAVIHGLNFLWGLGLSIKKMCEIGVKLGADVPFCIMGQGKANQILDLEGDELAATCALAEGIGEKLKPVKPLDCQVLLSKPAIGVSTAEVYKGIDKELGLVRAEAQQDTTCLKHHIQTKALIEGLNERNYNKIISNMVNILELFSIKRYPVIMYTKDMIEKQGSAMKVLMSGSGPTVFAIYLKSVETDLQYKALCEVNKETYLTKTLI